MKILMVSALSGEKRATGIRRASGGRILNQQVQKYNGLFVKGLVVSGIAFVESISTCNWISRLFKIKYLPGSTEVKGGVIYRAPPAVMIPFVQYLWSLLVAFVYTSVWIIRNGRAEPLVVVCDVVEQFSHIGTWIACRLFGVKTVALITDLPWHLVGNSNKRNLVKSIATSLWTEIARPLVRRHDAYVLLTEHMNDVVNPKRRPFVVIEGLVDPGCSFVPKKINDSSCRVILYAGMLEKRFGIDLLIEAFNRIHCSDCELVIYGQGTYADFVTQASKINTKIRFYGSVPNEVVLQAESNATILVNPRSKEMEFAKYSFPSKVIEYMSTGTPVVMMALPGIPRGYLEHVFVFEEYNADCLARVLMKVLDLPDDERRKRGDRAQQFVYERVDYREQIQKVTYLVERLIND
jgi:glycosyltransferase involved in cell wall biosynthesis